MKNYIAKGETLRVVTPAGGLVAGAVAVIGAFIGIPALTTAEGEINELSICGVYALPSTGSVAFGDVLYFNATSGVVTKTKATGLYKIGAAVGPAVANVVEVRLNGQPTVAEA
jgi:predicted RecA/RadA family phage recombinase